MVNSLKSEGEQGTYILCGDFNIEPQSPAYQLLQEGDLTNKEMTRLKGVDYIRWGPGSPAPSQVLYVIYLEWSNAILNNFLFSFSTISMYIVYVRLFQLHPLPSHTLPQTLFYIIRLQVGYMCLLSIARLKDSV